MSPFTRLRLSAAFSLIAVIGSVLVPTPVSAQTDDETGFITAIRFVPAPDLGVETIDAIAYSPSEEEFVLAGQTGSGSALLTLTAGTESTDVVELDEPIGNLAAAYVDTTQDRLVALDADTADLVVVDDSSGDDRKQSVNTRKADRSLEAATGLVQNDDGSITALDSSKRRLVTIAAATAGADAIDNPGSVTQVRLSNRVPRGDLVGLAVSPSGDNLMFLAEQGQILVEASRDGELVSTYDLSDTGIQQGTALAIAPSSDPTDDPAIVSAFIVDETNTSNRLAELAFEAVAVVANASPSSVINTTDTSLFNPPSPDPVGIVVLDSAPNQLLISDSEVNEMSIFAGVNLFATSLTGTLANTGDVTSFSNEPTGLGINQATGELYVSDDNNRNITTITAGVDGLYGTIDDVIVSQMSTTSFGSNDPEGVTYDSLRNRLAIIDGVAREVYLVEPGPDGLFNGVGDVATQFDVAGSGSVDPEGITYHAPTDTLLVVDRAPDVVFEFTPTGTLVRTIDVTAASEFLGASGIAIGPRSTNAAELSMYIVDRGVDNDDDPNENDGKIYEMSFTPFDGNIPPMVDAGPYQPVSTTAVSLDGTVTDDGLPNPPGVVTTSWSQVSGPAGVTFANPSAVDTTATLPGPGTYVLRLTADDSGAVATDDVTVSLGAIDVRIATGSDDAEEQPNGSIDLSSTDLDMIIDRGTAQTVGMRFTGIAIPQGATITAATVQFQADENDTVATNLIIHGEAADNPGTFTGTNNEITSKALTTASAAWAPPSWTSIGASGPDQTTSDLSAVIQEIINRPGWTAGNALVLIVSGSGERIAESYNGTATGAPLLHVEYSTGPANDTPVAVDDVAITDEDVAVLIDVAANDTDVDGNLDPTTVTITSGPTNGGATNNGDGTITYTPNPDYNGGDTITYQICDDLAACDIATVAITVNPINDTPVANNDTAITSRNTATIINVATNDTDIDGNLDPTTVTITSGPTNGGATNNGDGTITYTPTTDYTGPDSLTYQICDNLAACDTATVTITVTITNDFPVAVDDVAITDEDVAVLIDVAANDTDVDGNLDPTTVTITSGPTNGGATNNGDGTITYTPNPDYNGGDTITYQICDDLAACDTATVTITVNPINDTPVANNDTAITSRNTATIINVATNDTDTDGNLDPTTVTITANPSNGGATNNGDGTITYTPTTDYTGPDSLTYQICDNLAACDTATVTITVEELQAQTVEVRVGARADDAEERSGGQVSLGSSDLELVTDRNGPQTVGMRFAGVSIPANATITNAWIQFQVDEVSNGAADLVFRAQAADDALAFSNTSGNISSRPVTAASRQWVPPTWPTVGAAGADQQTPDLAAVVQEVVSRGGWVPGNAIVIVVTGSGNRTAEAHDGVSSAAPLLHVEFLATPPANRAPVAANDSTSTVEDTSVVIDVAANDSDPDGNLDPTTTTITSPVSNGGTVNNGDGTITYTPTVGYTGTDTFTYQICDTDAVCDSANVDITIIPDGGGAQVIEVRVSAGTDDAEERDTGKVSLTSSDLELIRDRQGPQTVGMRFNNVSIPSNATVTAAWIQFQVDETSSEATDLVIRGQAADNPTGFLNVDFNITSRPTTTSQVAWQPLAWLTVGEAGLSQRTPDLASVVQEIVDRGGWSSGNSMVMVVSGSGARVAEAYNGSQAGAPLLHVEYTTP